MRSTLAILAAGVMLAGLAGCGTVPTAGDTPSAGGHSKLDTELMAAVESSAKVNGADVYWINPPTKRKE